jgi:MFS family permease
VSGQEAGSVAARNGSHLRIIEPLRDRSYFLLWSGQTVSRLGDSAYSTVLSWTAYTLTLSTAATGYVLTAFSIPMLVMVLVGGIVGDRVSRRGLILTSDLLSGCAVGAVALLAAVGHLSLALLVVLAATFGVVSAFFSPAYQALIPDVVPEERLQQANALQMLSGSTSQIVGPALGAVLYGWGRAAAAFGFDAMTFFVAALATTFLRVPPRPLPERKSIWSDVRDGWDYVRRTTWLWFSIAIATILNALGNAPFFVLLPAVIHRHHLGIGSLGLTFTIAGIVAVVANTVLGQLSALRHRGTIIFAVWSLIGISTMLVGLAPSLVLILVAGALKGVTYCGDTIYVGIVQQYVPAEYRSRVFSLDMLGSFALYPVGLAVSGIVAAAIGPEPTLIAGGAVALALSVAGMLLPAMRALD